MIKWIKNKINLEEKHKDKEFQKLNSKIKFKQVTQVDLEQNQSKKKNYSNCFIVFCSNTFQSFLHSYLKIFYI